MSQEILRENIFKIAKDTIEYIQFLKDIGISSISNVEEISKFTKDTELSEFLNKEPINSSFNQSSIKTSISPEDFYLSNTMNSANTTNSLFELLESGQEKINLDKCLDDIKNDIGDCQRCKLAPTRRNIVFGDGNPNTDLVFVGEAPGADEDASGLPFVGRAGQLLTKIIEAIGLSRKDVYICNVVKCRPPENRTPEKDEIETCSGFLHRQLALLKPKVIVSLGAPAAFTLLGNNKLGRISDIRGTFYDYRGIPLMVTFHPAYLLRSPTKKREVWEDMKQVRDLLASEKSL